MSRNSSICHKPPGESRRLLFRLAAAAIILLAFARVYALDPARTVSQYTRDFWGIEKGYPGGTVYAIAQTGDGYLWLGTEKGLVRFDGLRFESLQPSAAASAMPEPVLGLTTDAEGGLWIRLRGSKVVRYRDGKFEDVLTDSRRPDYRVTAMTRGSDGRVLITTLGDGTLRYDGERFVPVVAKPNLPQSIVISVAETQSSDVWMGTRDAGLFRFDGQQTVAVTDKLPDRKINCLLPAGESQLWVGTDKGIIIWNGTELSEALMPPTLKKSQILTLLKDRQQNIWIGTDSRGLWRFNGNGLTTDEKNSFPSNKMVTALYEDREGNLWIGSPQGLERWRDNSFLTFSTAQGLPSESGGALYANSASEIWFAPPDGGLYRLRDNRVERVAENDLGADTIYSIAGRGAGDLWLGRQRGGLTHLQYRDSITTVKTYTQTNGLAQTSVFAVFASSDDSVWAGTLSGGVSRLKNGQFITYTNADGLASNAVNDIAETADGTMWFATPAGLSSLSKNNWRNFTTKDGLPVETVNCLLRDSGGGLWIGTAKGLAFYDGSQIRFNRNAPAALHEPIYGIAEDGIGSIWISTANRVLQIERAKLLDGAFAEADAREFGLADGLFGLEGVKRSRSVVADSEGQIWFSMNRGISVVSPQQLKAASVPALVQINSLTADGAKVDLQNTFVRLSAASQRITIGYIGLSLALPERVRYRYKLEGFDEEWSQPTAFKEAVYTNLSPGSYRFHVVAGNGDGLWNGEAAVVDLIIEPLFWQTWWFRFLGLILLSLLVVFTLRVREYRLTRDLNIRFEERLAERTILARELHDSMLQGVVGASIQLDVAIDQLPDDQSSKQSLSKVLQTMKRVIDEGRNTVRGLRASDSDSEKPATLEESFSEMWRNFPVRGAADFRLVACGTPRPLHPLVRDEVYRIGGEALINAFRHSEAGKIEIEIDYQIKYFKVSVRDDGCGIDPQILSAGRREGHWGLLGMRERAERIGARLKVWSRRESGTEIELIVPSRVAFEPEKSENHLTNWLKKFHLRRSKMNSLERK